MDGDDDARGRFPLDHPAPEGTDSGIPTEDGASGGGAEADDERGRKRRQLAFEPAAAGVELALRGCLVDPSRAAGRPLEVLDCIGNVDGAPVQPRRDERPIEETSGRADERPSDTVFDVARLFPNEHDTAVRSAFAKYGLRRAAPKWARGAP